MLVVNYEPAKYIIQTSYEINQLLRKIRKCKNAALRYALPEPGLLINLTFADPLISKLANFHFIAYTGLLPMKITW